MSVAIPAAKICPTKDGQRGSVCRYDLILPSVSLNNGVFSVIAPCPMSQRLARLSRPAFTAAHGQRAEVFNREKRRQAGLIPRVEKILVKVCSTKFCLLFFHLFHPSIFLCLAACTLFLRHVSLTFCIIPFFDHVIHTYII